MTRAQVRIMVVCALLIGSYLWASSQDDPRKDPRSQFKSGSALSGGY